MKPANPNRLFQREGLSLVELLMAMTLLALISMAGLKGGGFWQGRPFDLAIRNPDNLEVQIGMVQAEKVNPLFLRVSDIAAFRRKANVWVNDRQTFHYTNFSFGLEGRADCYTQTDIRITNLGKPRITPA